MDTNTPNTESAKQNKLYTVDGTLRSDVEIRSNSNNKPYAYAKIEGKNGKTHTIMTHVKAGIEVLTGKKSGDAIRLFGTFEQQDKGRTFSAMGLSVAPEPKAAPAEEAAAEVAG